MAEVHPGVQSSSTQFVSDTATLQGFLARPSVEGRRPALLVIQEWWGLNDHIREICERFAREGYVVLAPDLYSRMGAGKVTKDGAEAAKWMESLQTQQVLRDLNAAVTHVKTFPFVDPLKLAVVGFCMGGSFALMMAGHNSDLKAAVPFYGQIPPSDSFRYLLCPVLYVYGAQHGWIPKTDVERLRQGLQQQGKPGEVVIYPDAGHAFFNDTRPEAYRPNDAQDAWRRTLSFLSTHL